MYNYALPLRAFEAQLLSTPHSTNNTEHHIKNYEDRGSYMHTIFHSPKASQVAG